MIRTLFTSPTQCETLPELWAQAAECGFDGVGPMIGEDTPLSLATPESQCGQARREVENHGLQVTAVSLAPSETDHFGAADAQAKARAIRRTEAALERAAWLGARTLIVVPAHVEGPSRNVTHACPYGEALNGTHAALQQLRFAAERCGVTIALAAVRNRFLLSPVELRELLDGQHSPTVGACLDLEAVQSIGSPCDWIRTLGWRVHAVRLGCVPAGSAPVASSMDSVDTQAVFGALREIEYSGILGAAGSASGLIAGGLSPGVART